MACNFSGLGANQDGFIDFENGRHVNVGDISFDDDVDLENGNHVDPHGLNFVNENADHRALSNGRTHGYDLEDYDFYDETPHVAGASPICNPTSTQCLPTQPSQTSFQEQSSSASFEEPERASSTVSGDESESESEGNDSPVQQSTADELDEEEEDRHDTLSATSRNAVHARLRTTLTLCNLDPQKLRECLEMIDDLEDKTKKRKGLRKKHPRNHEEIMVRLRGMEENIHPWGVITETPTELWRCWDEISKAQIRNSNVGSLSGGADWKWGLDNRRGRRLAITRHANWSKNRMATPFISTTTSWQEICKVRIPHMENRQLTKGIEPNTKITLFNPRARAAAHMPILRMATEQRYYRVKTQYSRNSRHVDINWYRKEYLLLYSAGPDEIVHTWTWGEIKRAMKANNWSVDEWRTNAAEPLLLEHEKARLEGRKMTCEGGCSCCGHP